MIIYRNSTPEDAAQVAACVRSVARERRYLASVEGFSVEQTRAFLAALRGNGGVQVVAMEGAAVVGWCDVNPVLWEGMRHVAKLGIGVAASHRGLAIGRTLLRKVLEEAAARGLWRVELDVFSSNERAIRLYEQEGFVLEGRKRLARRIDGCDDDLLVMARIETPGGD